MFYLNISALNFQIQVAKKIRNNKLATHKADNLKFDLESSQIQTTNFTYFVTPEFAKVHKLRKVDI